jgi:hypothetical protein
MIFIEDHGFQKRRKGLMENEELFRLTVWLAIHPELGKVIPAAGGLRKVRLGRQRSWQTRRRTDHLFLVDLC